MMRLRVTATTLLALCCLVLVTTTTAADTIGKKKENIAKNCVMALSALFQEGDGSTSSSCMSCDPALDTCFGFCQALIDKVYYFCDDVCLPQDYYFDAKSTFSGCWPDVKGRVKIGVERCGCNSAYSSVASYSVSIAAVALCIVVFLLT